MCLYYSTITFNVNKLSSQLKDMNWLNKTNKTKPNCMLPTGNSVHQNRHKDRRYGKRCSTGKQKAKASEGIAFTSDKIDKIDFK